MRTITAIAALCLIATSAIAETIQPGDAAKNAGKSVTVEGIVGEVHHAASGKVIFIDIGGRSPNNVLAGVVFAADAAKFASIDTLEGKTVDMTGVIRLYQGRPEIILNDPAQIKAK